MTLENLKTDTDYAIRNSNGKIIYKADSAERAVAHADRVFPTWRTHEAPWSIVRVITVYDLVPS
jgi:hypothetical protein